MTIDEEQQLEQCVQDTQMPAMSPPHDTNRPKKTIIVKDFPNSSPYNINPLIGEDLKKILDRSTLQAILCENPVLASVDELQKEVADITRDKVNKQEPPSTILTTTSGQPPVHISVETTAKVDTIVKFVMIEQQTQTLQPTNYQEGKIEVSIPNTQTQGAGQIILIDQGRLDEEK